MAFDTFSSFFLIKSATIGCPKGCVAKIATNYQYWKGWLIFLRCYGALPKVNVKTWTLPGPWSRAPQGPGAGTMYPLNPPLAGPNCAYTNMETQIRRKYVPDNEMQCSYQQGMVGNIMEDDFSIFHTGNFLPFYFHSIQKNLPYYTSMPI